MKNIVNDLRKDIEEYRSVKNFKTDQNDASLWLLDYMIDRSKPIKDTSKFLNNLSFTMYFTLSSSNHTPFDLGTSTGNLDKLTSDSLLANLSMYFESIQLEQHLNDTKRFTNSYMENNLYKKYLVFSKSISAFD